MKITHEQVREHFHPDGCRYFDEAGREVLLVSWMDPQEGTFGQVVTDEDGDPAFEILRFGKLMIERLNAKS